MKGTALQRTHTLEDVALTAESLGLAKIPRESLSRVQCKAGVRYGEISVSEMEAVEAQYAALGICREVAYFLRTDK